MKSGKLLQIASLDTVASRELPVSTRDRTFPAQTAQAETTVASPVATRDRVVSTRPWQLEIILVATRDFGTSPTRDRLVSTRDCEHGHLIGLFKSYWADVLLGCYVIWAGNYWISSGEPHKDVGLVRVQILHTLLTVKVYLTDYVLPW